MGMPMNSLDAQCDDTYMVQRENRNTMNQTKQSFSDLCLKLCRKISRILLGKAPVASEVETESDIAVKSLAWNSRCTATL